MKHTPGPWIAIEGGLLEGDVVITSEARRDLDIVCICEVDTDYEGEIGVEQDANAKLIAAAPELLQTLSDILPLLKYLDDEGWEKVKRARLAIEKATT